MGIDYQDVWVVNYSNSYQTKNTDSLDLYYGTLVQTIKSMPQVKGVSFTSDNIAFLHNQNTSGITVNKKRIDGVNWYTVGDDYKDVLNMQLLDGRWFNKNDAATTNTPVIINADLKEQLFGAGQAVGKVIGDGDDKRKLKVIGVVQSIKIKGDYAATDIGLYQRADTGSFRWLDKMLIKVSPDADAAFESKLYKTIADYMKGSDVQIEHMSDDHTSMNYFTLVPMIVLLIVACFLIINVALGLFGVLWYNINKRRGEIGLRRAVGATGNSVSAQLVNEAMILATLSLIIGTFFAVQFPLLNLFNLPASVYIIAIFLSIIFIYLLVFVCSLYPGKQAAAIYPAVALHEE